ncbi:hypothetical protein TUBRATIS_20760 [Tubulinosema ratisbonensis]|uniref:Uncharacterized protein n=1 Tax=Tubulinosema ratisbonensis TaxID=291195 RepID=A0A437AK98_9MICR|nr:hypothetical protein TUBRATIS_20760 [Tubulinosema ratisbonensis]
MKMKNKTLKKEHKKIFRSKRPDLFYLNDKIKNLATQYKELCRQNLKLIDKILEKKAFLNEDILVDVNNKRNRIVIDEKTFYKFMRKEKCRNEKDELYFFYARIKQLNDYIQELKEILYFSDEKNRKKKLKLKHWFKIKFD